ncbi:MAG: bifunctional riboflavin kinase/FAD synthetase [Flavobacteriaceae bacterium]|nr:bifunctional riboflavin kinase/FAD synthetase [Flavobacteriaceae bacterium]
MKITRGFSNFSTTKKTILTIGTFDGVHLGHQKVIEQLINTSNKEKKTSLLLTFFPHPRMILQKSSDIKLINTIEEKTELLQRLGLQNLIIQPFDYEFSRLTALEFVRDVLVTKLNISKLIIGYDHRFGKNREGDFGQLQEHGEMFGFEVEEISAQSLNDIAISSTKIRKALNGGNIQEANNYLGYNFTISGEVVTGNNLGEKLGFPTANISIKEDYKLIPKTGVYIVKSTIDNVLYFGMMNIGNRPTINGKHQTIEVNFFDLDKNLYGKFIKIELLKFLRNEQKFNSIDDLKAQLHQDKKTAQKIIAESF